MGTTLCPFLLPCVAVIRLSVRPQTDERVAVDGQQRLSSRKENNEKGWLPRAVILEVRSQIITHRHCQRELIAFSRQATRLLQTLSFLSGVYRVTDRTAANLRVLTYYIPTYPNRDKKDFTNRITQLKRPAGWYCTQL